LPLIVAAVLDDHYLVVMAVPAVVAMSAEFGARAVAMVIAVSDHNGLGAGDRRRRNSDHPKGGNDVSKLLHVVSSICED
jgi:hypothetical protein